jgi:ornithine carbamoyltransferase
MKQDFLSIADVAHWQLQALLDMAMQLKQQQKQCGGNAPVLAGKTLGMIFEKPSLRTRLSFEVAMYQMGGHAVSFTQQDIGLGTRESVADVARVAVGMTHALMARVYAHETLEALVKHSDKPVINGLSDLEHPCQILADLLMIQEKRGALKGITVAFVGDGCNNVTHSLAVAAGMAGFHLRVAHPQGYGVDRQILKKARVLAQSSEGSVEQMLDPRVAVRMADVVYTDTWVSMGRESQKKKRMRDFAGFQVTGKLMALAKPNALFMHDLPAQRGMEVAADVIDGSQSVVFDQAENRLHAQKALLVWLLGGGRDFKINMQ